MELENLSLLHVKCAVLNQRIRISRGIKWDFMARKESLIWFHVNRVLINQGTLVIWTGIKSQSIKHKCCPQCIVSDVFNNYGWAPLPCDRVTQGDPSQQTADPRTWIYGDKCQCLQRRCHHISILLPHTTTPFVFATISQLKNLSVKTLFDKNPKIYCQLKLTVSKIEDKPV